MPNPPKQGEKAPDFIPAEPEFIPAGGVSSPDPTLLTSTTGPYTSRPTGPTWGDRMMDVGKGAVKGLMHTGSEIGALLSKIPSMSPWVETTPDVSEGKKAIDVMATPEGTAQKIGYGGEQIAEWLVPTGAEEKAGVAAAKLLPRLGKAAAPLGRIVAGGLESGVRNKMQGGDFSSGALMGGGTGALGEVGKAVAPKLAESALGITKRMRGFGKTPGEAVLGEIKGIRPGTIAANAGDKLGLLTSELEQAASRSNTPATTQPAIQVVTDAMQKAKQQNNKTLYNALKDVHDQLTVDFSSGQALPVNMPARQLLDLKRGIGDLEGNWNPELRGKMKGTVRQVYSALDKELDRAVPGAKELNQRISSLIPVKQRGESVERGAGVSERLMHRVATHTGAALPGLAAGYYGYKHGGPAGAIAGFALPELMASPTGQMMAARMLRSGLPTQALRGASSQLMKRNTAGENKQEGKDNR